LQQAELEPIDKLPQPIADPLGVLVISLLKGVIYKKNDERLWSALLKLQARVRDYITVLGLELILDEAEEYAFLRSAAKPDIDDPAGVDAPRLVARRPLSFPVSLLLALLRKKLAEMDARSGDTRLVLSRDEVVELIRVFLPEATNDTKLVKQIDTHLNKIVELGFLRRLKAQSQREDTFEVQRILKAFIDADWLARLDERLDAYKGKLLGQIRDDVDE
jgi:hypothetical protein